MVDSRHADSQQRQMTALIEAHCDYTRPRRGEVREAVILSISENDLLVDLGGQAGRHRPIQGSGVGGR